MFDSRFSTFKIAAAIALIITSGMAAKADPGTESWINKTVKFSSCSADQTVLIETTLKSGLEKLSQLNYDLLSSRIASSVGYTVTFDCSPASAVSNIAVAETWSLRQKSLLGIGIGKISRLPNSQIRLGKLLYGKDELDKPELVILHEFLHFLRFDNLPNRLHSDLLVTRYQTADFQDKEICLQNELVDVVYSCSMAATLSARRPLQEMCNNDPLTLEQAATTCRSARINQNDEVDIDMALLTWIALPGLQQPTSLRCLMNKTKWDLLKATRSQLETCAIKH